MSRLGTEPPLLVGEVFVDFTVAGLGFENKLRLGGIAHAARGFWALGVAFNAAVVLPEYLIDLAKRYFASLGCVEFSVIGVVRGAPNVTVLFDAAEVGDQRYETLLRDEKVVDIRELTLDRFPNKDVLMFPGTYSLEYACSQLLPDVRLHLDIAYDVGVPEEVASLERSVETIFISTSSHLFRSISARNVEELLDAFHACAPATLVLKENRGGSRLVSATTREVVSFPAQLGSTINSVGVGDVFAATYLVYINQGYEEAGWRATYASAAYAQTTCPDLFRTYVQRDSNLHVDEMKELWGTLLPWEMRQELQIYLAAPDFVNAERSAIDLVLGSLEYHGFRVRRPVVENGELPRGAEFGVLRRTYEADYSLLQQCNLVFAVPTDRDPGTLVEIGLAIEMGIPVVVFDPTRENSNTMVMAGSSHYSDDLDSCLNATFSLLGVGRD